MKKMAEYSDTELLEISRKGVLAKAFYDENKFYRDIVEPAVIDESARLRRDNRWSPQKRAADPAAEGILSAYMTGREDGLLFLEDFCARLCKEGAMALEEVKKRADKVAKASEKTK